MEVVYMTRIYFVRHAQPIHSWQEDSTRPLTKEGITDSKKVVETLANIKLDYCVSSPYKRSLDTIKECAKSHGLEIHTDYRYRERECGNKNTREMIIKRWLDFDFHEEGGESLNMVQRRNMEGVTELLLEHENENILFGTHGTALSTILNYYDSTYNFDSFWRIIDFMPYIVCLESDGTKCLGKKEILIIKKEFKD